MEQLNSSFSIITSTHLDPPLTFPASSIDDNANALSINEAGSRGINLHFPNELYGYPFSGCWSTYTAIPSLSRHGEIVHIILRIETSEF